MRRGSINSCMRPSLTAGRVFLVKKMSRMSRRGMRSSSVGLLPIDKPAGPTSHDVVDIARKAFGIRRIGHTGTLDPFATGLLILAVGWATRLSEYIVGLDKVYQGRIRLGIETDSSDLTGAVVGRSEGWRDLSREEIERALERQLGEIDQVPPAHSAKRVGGERAYRSEEHTSELQSRGHLVCRLLLETTNNAI